MPVLWQVTMLDTLRKRCDFVNAAATAVGLTNVKTLWMRAEDAGQDPKLREARLHITPWGYPMTRHSNPGRSDRLRREPVTLEAQFPWNRY